MALGNYDILVQLHEKALNKALAMVFYKGMLRVEGTFELDSELPDTMQPFTTFDYVVALENEPFVDFRGADELFLRFSAELRVTILDSIVLKFDVDFYAKSTIKVDLGDGKLYYELHEAKIVDIAVQDKYYFSIKFLKKLNHIIGEIIDAYFKSEIKELEIPIALDGIQLPYMPAGDENKLQIKKVDIKIFDKKILMVGISFFQSVATLNNLQNLAGNKDCYIAIRNEAILKVLDFWWERTTFPKKLDFEETVEIGFANPLASGLDKATRILTLGFIQTERDYENVMLTYGGEVGIDKKPIITLKTGDLVEVTQLEIVADVFANIMADVKKDVDFDTSSFLGDHITPWRDDLNIREVDKTSKLLDIKNRFTLHVNTAQGKLTITENNNLAIKVTEADFRLEFTKKGTTFSDNTWEKLMDFLKEKVIERIPAIIVSPSLILAEKNIYGFTLGLSDTFLNISDSEIEFSTNVLINELKSNTVAVPNYIGNKLTKTIHELGCKFVDDIDMGNRVGYYVMYEALAEHYKACNHCLKSYNIR